MHLKSGRRLVLMVRALHDLGYGQLRLAPSIAPSGVYWRTCITHAGNISRSHGAITDGGDQHTVYYTSGEGDTPFHWKDAAAYSPETLAEKFIERFPDLAAKGQGEDADYTNWYSEMVSATEPEGLIYAYSDWDDSNTEYLNVIGNSQSDTVPYPPPGWRKTRDSN